MAKPISRRSNLPIPLSSFIGRDEDIAGVCELFMAGARLVTLTGPGGVGKTRLALAVAEKLEAGFESEVVFVSLAPISDARLVVPTIARSLGVEESVDQPILDRVVDHLDGHRAALILDNVEHVLDAAPDVASLLQACPELVVLATGREPLRLQGEHIYEVRSLGLPPESGGQPAHTTGESPAVALFVDRASQAARDFVLTPENRPAVHAICHRVDGLPLALELAAARLKALSAEDLLCRLDQPLSVLTGGPQDAPDRQQTMRATIQWSYDLLTPGEQRLLRHMSVFAGGGTLEAIEAVSPGDTAIDDLSSLVDKSLVRRSEDPDGRTRYDLLEPVRQFADEQLRLDARETECARNRHAEHCRTMVDGLRNRIDAPDGPAYLDSIERENDNIRAALNWYLESDQIELGLDLVGEVGMFWVLRSHVHEGLAYAESFLLHSPESAPTKARVKALWVSVWMNFRRREWDRAYDLANEVYCSARQINFQEYIAHGLFDRGLQARARGEFQKAAELWDEALSIFRSLDKRAMVVRLLANYGLMFIMQGDVARATELADEGLAIGRANDLKISTALTLGTLADAALQSGDIRKAAQFRRDQLRLYIELNHHEGISNNLRSTAEMCRRRGQAAAGTRLLAAGIALLERRGLKYNTAAVFQHEVIDEFERLRAMLPESRFEEARAAGSAMTKEDAGAYALEILTQEPLKEDAPPDGLTPREAEVLSLIAAGRSNREMADDLYLSIRTIERHVANIYRKIDVHNRAEAARYAIEQGLVVAETA